MQVSAHFNLAEFERSETAARLGLPIVTPDRLVTNIRLLCERILEPLRAELGAPIVVLSGYRPPAINKAVGGSPRSEHIDARAADIIAVGVTPLEICRTAALLRLPFNQCIYEFREWCHVSVPVLGVPPRRELLTASRELGRTIYREGIT